MEQSMVIQGRHIETEDIAFIGSLMAEHPDWGRTRLSEELCRRWNWRNAQGRIKDMAARTLLLKLDRRGLIDLPARQRPSTNHLRNLIPPWVQVPHLASHVLGLVARRIRADWQSKYGHPVHALENLRGPLALQGDMLPGRQLAAPGRDPGPHPQ